MSGPCAAGTADSAAPLFPAGLSPSPLSDSEQHQKLGHLLNYVRQEGMGLVPGLPSVVRDPGSWMTRQLRTAGHSLGFGGIGADGGDSIASLFQPLSSLALRPSPEDAEAVWFAPGYHHKGFLPFNDAIVLGVSARHSLLNNRMRIEVHPYYGQSWVSQRRYWGTDITVNIDKELGLAHPGKLVFGYTNGDSSLLDHGHGLDMHTELQFTEHLALNTGIREGSGNQAGNYALLQWKMDLR